MATAWLSVEQVRTQLGADLSDPLDTAAMQAAVDAAAVKVEYWRADLYNEATPPVFEPDAAVVYGTAMLAYRFYQRRTSPLGVAGYTEYGTMAMIRHDPDIAKLLGIADAGPFVFGAG